MLLVPRQLQRTGMTRNVPYYGGRFTSAQAYAAAHPGAVGPPRPLPQDRQPCPFTVRRQRAGVRSSMR
jgi:hypothetical protein